MEQSAAALVSQWQLNVVKQPGLMRLGSSNTVARGADAIMHFRWRASRCGLENSAMLPHSGEQSRTFQEVLTLGS